MNYRIGVDTGGTFTDVVLLEEQSERIHITKTHSTPNNAALAVINGILKIFEIAGLSPEKLDFLVHGTTVATNALLEYKGVETALLLTEGFKDVLSIARQTRPKLYDWTVKRPDPFIPRQLRYEIPERITFQGEIRRKLNEDRVRQISHEIQLKNIKNVAVCFLHSYANPIHEQKVKEIFQKEYPEIKICLSSDILKEIREYERMSTTVINAYVMPIIENYLAYLLENLNQLGINVELNIMQSNGGIMTAQTASEKSINTILSGPAGGVIGCLTTAQQAGVENAITIDMGGTSFDISMIHQGEIKYIVESELAGHPIKSPMIDIHTIGAGGGSIAWIDHGGALRVGPHSAGSDPGPVCYGKGGDSPTVTDANLVLGRLNAKYYLGGEVSVDFDAAKYAIERSIANPLGLSVEEAAAGIIKVVNASMMRGIRRISVEKGHDAREFCLICFGGTGALHAADLALDLDITEVIVPLHPGVHSALGLLTADFRYDYSTTYLTKLDSPNIESLNSAFEGLEAEAYQQMEKEGISKKTLILTRTADMRYCGQAYELNVPVPRGELGNDGISLIKNNFNQKHHKLYGYARDSEPMELVYLRLSATAVLAKPMFPSSEIKNGNAEQAIKEHRSVYFEGGYQVTNIYDRSLLNAGNQFSGPAIIEQQDSTILVHPGQTATIDQYQNIKVKL